MAIVGFIGLGHMGLPMVKNLLQRGHEVHVYDIVAKNSLVAKQFGAVPAVEVAELAANVDALFLSVQTGEQVAALCRGPQGIFAHAHRNLLIIDCSSIDVATTQALHAEAASKDLLMLDAPVSGGVAGANAATLTIMVGGSKMAYDRALPYLSCVGKKIIHVGNDGLGQAAKICNNMLLAISMIGVSEAFNLATKLGIDAKKFYEISANASGQCWSMTNYCPYPQVIANAPSNNNYQPGFMAKMMLKDLNLALQAAQQVNANIPLGQESSVLYQALVDSGQGELDFSAIIKLLQGDLGA